MNRFLIVLPLIFVVVGCRRPSPSPVFAHKAVDPLSSEALVAEVARLTSETFLGRGSYQVGGKRAALYVATEFRKLGLQVIHQTVRGEYAENVIAIKPGGPAAVIVSAHHDHLGKLDGRVFPGADDNASGLALLLGIARARAHESFDDTVLFVSFGAEEDGLMGSAAYIAHPTWPLARTKAFINFDMVGRRFFEAGANRRDAVAVVGLAETAAAEATRKKAEEVSLALIEVPARLLELFQLHDRTDDWWFRRQRIPSIHFTTGYHDDYHQTTDTLDKIVPSQLAKIGTTAAYLLDVTACRDGWCP